MRAAVFLDRDGTLIEEKCYLSRPEQVRLLPGAAEALTLLNGAGFACVMVSNQSGLGRGLFTEADLHAIHEEMNRQLQHASVALDGLFYCPIVPTISDPTVIEHPDRKPGPGMLLRAARELHLDLAASWMVGDSARDILAGRNAGCRGGILLRSGHDITASLAHLGRNDIVADELLSAARWILNARPAAAT